MQEIAYQVVRSNRKSVALVIDNEANLIAVSYTHLDVYKRQLGRCLNKGLGEIEVWVKMPITRDWTERPRRALL